MAQRDGELLDSQVAEIGERRHSLPALGESEASELTIRVHNTQGEDVLGAEVWAVHRSGNTEFLGLSSVKGVTCNPALWLEGPASHISVEAEGYAPRIACLHRYEGTIVVVITRPLTLLGTVLYESDSAPAGGVSVLAWLSGASPDTLDIHDAMVSGGSSSSIHLALTSSDGSFSIEGLDPYREYTLWAGRPGYASKNPTVNVGTAMGPCQLKIGRIYGACITIQDARGGPAVVSGSLLDGVSSVSWSEAPDLLEPMGSNRIAWTIAGGDPALFGAGPGVIVDAGYSRTDEHPGASFIRLDLPGYEPETIRYVPGSLEEELVTVAADLRCSTTAWGTLTVILDHDGPLANGASPSQSLDCVVVLRSEGTLDRYPLSFTAEDACVVDGVPTGSYQVQFVVTSSGGAFVYPEQEVPIEISPGNTDFVVPIEVAGTLSIQISEPSGLYYDGPVTATLWRSPEIESGPIIAGTPMFFSPRKPPYLLSPISPGSYLIRILRPQFNSDTAGESMIVIRAGEQATIELALD